MFVQSGLRAFCDRSFWAIHLPTPPESTGCEILLLTEVIGLNRLTLHFLFGVTYKFRIAFLMQFRQPNPFFPANPPARCGACLGQVMITVRSQFRFVSDDACLCLIALCVLCVLCVVPFKLLVL